MIDWRTAVEVFPHTAFHLYDQTVAVVATRDGTAIINDKAPAWLIIAASSTNSPTSPRFGDAARDVLYRIATTTRACATNADRPELTRHMPTFEPRPEHTSTSQ